MTELKHLKIEKADGVARITFARPKHNVFNIEMMNELNGELEGLVADNHTL
jgi:cyclohexa-1,5-dienecarbonyl-CoA hydratase